VRVVFHKSVPDDLRTISEVAIRFYCDTFMDKEVFNKISKFRVRFGEMEEKDDIAWMDPMGVDDDDFKTLPTKFEMLVNERFKDIRISDYLSTLFHEMTHMAQYASGRLGHSPKGGWKWLGKRIPEDFEYYLHPWEIEAQGVETSALQLFHKRNPEFKILSRKNVRMNGRAKSSWKPLENQGLTNPVKSTT